MQPGIIDTPMARRIGVTHDSVYPQTRRIADMFAASLSQPTTAEVVAEVVRAIVEG